MTKITLVLFALTMKEQSIFPHFWLRCTLDIWQYSEVFHKAELVSFSYEKKKNNKITKSTRRKRGVRISHIKHAAIQHEN